MKSIVTRIFLTLLAVLCLMLGTPLFILVPVIITDPTADLFWRVFWPLYALMFLSHYVFGVCSAWSRRPAQRLLIPTVILNGLVLPIPLYWASVIHWGFALGAALFSALWWAHYFHRRVTSHISLHAPTTASA